MARFPLGVRTFRTKGDAISEVRRVLNAVPLETMIRGDDGVLVRDLFALHPGAAQKARGGVIGFMVRLNCYLGCTTRGFHVVHNDGSSTDFSYQPCFNARLAEPSVFAAMRAAIMLSQRQVMMQAFLRGEVARCPGCGGEMRRQGAHVHHVPPNRFRDLAQAFIAEHGMPAVMPSAHFGDDFADAADRLRWIEFHDARARRVVVCAPCNYAAEREEADASSLPS